MNWFFFKAVVLDADQILHRTILNYMALNDGLIDAIVLRSEIDDLDSLEESLCGLP